MANKILQLNYQSSYGVWDDLAREVRDRGIDVAVVQESPDPSAGLMFGLPGMVSVVPAGHRSRVGVHVGADLDVQRLDFPPRLVSFCRRAGGGAWLGAGPRLRVF